MKLIKDNDQQLDIEEALEGLGLERLDRHRILNKLLKPELRRYITNVKDNGTLDTLLYMDTQRELIENCFEKELKPGVAEEKLTEEEKAIRAAFQKIPNVLLNISNNYADWRISIKGFRSKQIVDAIASEYAQLQRRQAMMEKAFTPQEKIK